jgi:Predicted membrane protein
MLKPIRWNTFIRDFIVIQIGFLLYGLAIALIVRANLGTGTWLVLEVALANILGIKIGTMTVYMGFLILIIALALREQVGWGTLGNILSIGPWLNLSLDLISTPKNNLALQIAMFVLGVLIQGVATAVYIGVDAGAGPRDSLMLAIQRTTGVSLRVARGAIELIVVLIGWLLGGPLGVGTIIFALLIGPSVQWAFKLFKVQTHEPKVAEAAAD